MSATAGISAAKRRRGVSQAPIPSSNTQANTRVQPQTTQPVQISPIKILENHEIRLRKVEPRLENAFEGFEAHEKRLEQIENVLTQLIDNKPVGVLDTNSNNNNNNVTERLQHIERSLSELNVLISKVQTFAMETNMSLLRLSRESSSNETSFNNNLTTLNTSLNNTQLFEQLQDNQQQIEDGNQQQNEEDSDEGSEAGNEEGNDEETSQQDNGIKLNIS